LPARAGQVGDHEGRQEHKEQQDVKAQQEESNTNKVDFVKGKTMEYRQ
jgi:hypothetical protein